MSYLYMMLNMIKKKLISNKNQFEELKKTINKSDIISFDLETTDINPLNADIVGISFSFSNNEAYYIPILFPGEIKDYNLDKKIVISDLKAIWEDSKNSFIGQNIKYDCLVLACLDIKVKNIVFDTMLAAHLINPAIHEYKLDFLAEILEILAEVPWQP